MAGIGRLDSCNFQGRHHIHRVAGQGFKSPCKAKTGICICLA